MVPAKGTWMRVCEWTRVKCIPDLWFYLVTYLKSGTCRTCPLMVEYAGLSRTGAPCGRPGWSLMEEAVPDREAEQQKYGKNVSVVVPPSVSAEGWIRLTGT